MGRNHQCGWFGPDFYWRNRGRSAKKALHPEAAKLFIDYLTSDDAEQIYGGMDLRPDNQETV